MLHFYCKCQNIDDNILFIDLLLTINIFFAEKYQFKVLVHCVQNQFGE